ncbi:hypothetical protein B0H13DRAFT_1525672, partial [Mycena leptocephala]
PVLTLPNEIISEIFVHFLPTYPQLPPSFRLLSPTTLTHICRKWRATGLSTPALWITIQINHSSMAFERETNRSDVWLQRSGSCPLLLRVDMDYPDNAGVLSTVVAHRARWEDLRLHASRLPCSLFDRPIPLLRHLELSILYRRYQPEDVLVLRDVPLLRAVVLSHVFPSVSLPWVQLTSLTLKYVDAGNCIPILQQTANLVHCHLLLKIGFDSIFTASSLFNSNITLPSVAFPSFAFPSLESLTINAHGHRITKFLDCFIVPALHRLEIPEPFLGSSPIRSLESFISKSGCSLQDVSI